MVDREGCPPRDEHLTLADILRAHAADLGPLSRDQARVVSDLGACRSAALGGHLYRCDRCGRELPLYNSCRNRHCPQCQGLAAARWVEAQARDLLPVHYFHLVFTVSQSLHPMFRLDPRLAYACLFAIVAATLQQFARDEFGATLGIIAVLHTWTQTLAFHPHLHCIVSGGGMKLDGSGWVHSRPNFLFPVVPLSEVFRGKLLHSLEQALLARKLSMTEADGRALLKSATRTPWVVYAKAPMAGPEQVLRYLGRYTHHTAISNQRLVSFRNGEVCFRYRARSHSRRRIETMSLPAVDFLQRFLQHVLPRRLVRIRHYGLLANAFKSRRLALARSALEVPPDAVPQPVEHESWRDSYRRLVGTDPLRCPACHAGTLVLIAEVARPGTQPLRRPMLMRARAP